MAYSLELPNGTVVEGVPDNIPRFQALAMMRQQFPQAFDTGGGRGGWRTGPIFSGAAEAPPPPPRSGVTASFGKGVEQAASGLTTLGQSIFGNSKEAAEAGIKRSEEIAKKYTSEGDLEKIKAIYAEKGVGPALKEVARQFPHVLAENLPQILASIIGGMAGAAVAGPVGGVLGAGLVSGSMQAGSNLERQAEAQRERGEEINPSLGVAAGAGAAQAALDVFALGKLGLGRFIGMPAKAAEAELLATAQRSLKATVGRGMAAGAYEIPTEIAQQVIERAQAGLPLASEDAWKEYQQAGYAAALIGPSIGGAVSPLNRSAARDKIEEQERAKNEKETNARIAAEVARKASPEYLNSLEGIVDQKKAAIQQRNEAKRALAKAKNAAKNEEITPDELAAAEAEHAAAEEKVRALLAREIEVKKTPNQRFIEGVDQSYQYAEWGPKKDREYGPAVFSPAARAGQKQAQGEFLPGVPMSEAPKDALVDDRAPSKLDFTPDYNTATPEEALLLSLTNPQQYRGWLAQTAANQQEAYANSFDDMTEMPAFQTQPQGPEGRLMQQQDAHDRDMLAQQMGALREQSQLRRAAEQEFDATLRAASAMENWRINKASDRLDHPGTRPQYLMGDRKALGEFLQLKPAEAARASDTDILAAIERRIKALRDEQDNLAALDITTPQTDAAGNVVGVAPKSQERLNRLGQIDLELGDLDFMRRKFRDTATARDDLGAGMLAEAAAKAYPKGQQQEPRPATSYPTVPPTEIKPQRPVVAQSGMTSLVGQSQSRILPPKEMTEQDIRRERTKRAQQIGDSRDARLNEFLDLAQQIHRGEFIGEAEVEDGKKTPHNVKVDPSSAASTLPTLKKKAAGLIRRVAELSIAQAAELHAAKGSELLQTQAHTYAGQISTAMRRYLQRVEANVKREQFEPNPTTAETPESIKRAYRQDTPFDNMDAAEAELIGEIEQAVEGMANDIVGNYMNAPVETKRTRSPFGREVAMERPTPETLARRDQRERGTTTQQQRDYVYEKVRATLQADDAAQQSDVVRAALEQAEKALRESFEGVVNLLDKPNTAWSAQGQEPGSLSIYAGKQESKVTPRLLQDIEALIDTKDPQDARALLDGLRQVADVNVDDSTQAELFAGQDTPQVRIIKRSPFHLRQFINSKHVQQLKELLRPVNEWNDFLDKQLQALEQKFEASKVALVYDPATGGGYSKVRDMLETWKQTTNNLRAQAARMDAVNEQAKRNNYEAVEASIQRIYATYESLLADLNAQIDGDPLGEVTTYKDILGILETEYARLDEAARMAVQQKQEAGEGFQQDTAKNVRDFNRSRVKTLHDIEALKAKQAERMRRENRVREVQANQIIADIKAKARAAAEANKQAQERFKAATQVSAKQEKVVTEYPRQIPGSEQYVADRVIERKITKNDTPNAVTPLYDKYKAGLAAAEREGARIGEAEYDALPPAQRVKMDKWRNQITKVNEAASALAAAEKALTTFETQKVAPQEQAAVPEEAKRNKASKRELAKVQRTVPKKGTPAQIRALQLEVEKAELELLQQWDKLEQLSEGISDKLVKAGVKKALNLSPNASALEQVAAVSGTGQMPHGGQRPPQRVSPMNKTKHSLAAIHRAEMNKEKHPAEMRATRPGPRGETSPTTSSAAPYTKDMERAQSSAQELMKARLQAKFAKKRETLTAKGAKKRVTIKQDRAAQVEAPDAAVEAASAAQYPQRVRSAESPFGQKLATAVGDMSLPSGNDTVLRTGRAEGIAPEQATELAQKAQRLIPGLVYVPTFAQMPRSLAAKIAEAGGDPRDVKGGVLPDGTVFMVGDAHSDAADFDATVQHELVGHYKMDRVLFGNRTGIQLMRGLAAKHITDEKAGRDLMVELGFENNVIEQVAQDARDAQAAGQDHGLRLLREIVARTAEMKPGTFGEKAKRFFKELLGALKHMLREFGLDSKLSDADIFYMVQKAQRGEARAKEGGDTAFRTATAPAAVASGTRKLFPERERWSKSAKKNFMGFGLRTQYIDRWAPVVGVASRMADGLKAAQMVYFTRMADRTNQMTAEALTHGPVALVEKPRKDGRTEFIFQSTKGVNVRDILSTLKGHDFKQWAAWMALKRAQETGKGLSALLGDNAPTLTPEEVQAILAHGDSNPAFQKAREQYAQYNQSLVKLLVDTGAITQKAADDMLSRTYIPFYRVDPNGDVRVMGEHPIKIGNVRDQADLARLVGSDRPLDDPFQNIATNTRILMKLALQNEAAKSVAFTLKELGLAQTAKANMRGKAEQGRNTIHFKYKGEDWTALVNLQAPDKEGRPSKYEDIPSDLLVKGMEGIATTLPDMFRVLQVPAQFLRNAITLMPTYMFRQLLRDPMHAWISTGMDFRKASGALGRVLKLANGKDETGELLRERGLVGGQVIQGNDEDMGRIMAQLHAGEGALQKFHAKLHEYATASDAATRAAMYDAYKGKGLSDLEATLATMDAINFATRGMSPTVHALNMVIPFFNAQLQGLDSVYRAMTGQMPFNEKMKARQKLIQRAMLVAAGTTLYYSLVQDEEWYKNTPENVRLSNWLFKIPGVDEPIRIPIPFEFGFMFKAVPESIYMASKSDKEADAAWAAVRNMAANQLPGGSSFFLPAGVKPVVETAANHSFFTGKPIVPGSLEGEPASEQWTLNTTEAAKILAAPTGVSPMHFENLIRGYTGPAGYAVLQLIDAIVQPTAVPPPEKPLSRTAIVGPLFQQVDGPAVINRAYEQVKKIEAAAGRYSRAATQGRFDDAQAALQADDANLIGYKKFAGKFTQKMGELTKLERIIHWDPRMPPEEKAAQLKQIRALKIQMAQQFEQSMP